MNNKRLHRLLILLFTIGLVVFSGCRSAGGTLLPAAPTETVFVEPTLEILVDTITPLNPTDTPVPTETPLPTNTPQPEITATPLQPTITPTQGPLCTVLTDLNLRFGPGTAFRPPIRVLPSGFEVVPVGFNPIGIPGGPWVQVLDESRNELGWVSAGQQFVSCNIDLISLPQVVVGPPPTPSPPRVTNSVPDGSCFTDWDCELVFNPDFLVRLWVYDTFYPDPEDGAGIEYVNFIISDPDGQEVYLRSVTTSPFCIFGGSGNTCNPWVIEDFTHRWTPGGPPAASGDYFLQIFVEGLEGDAGNWRIDLNLQFP
jgi:hypothetical protein